MAKYITKKRKILLEYLENHPDALLNVKQIIGELANEDISLSAVYRNLCDLETEGKIRRVSRSGSREVYFQYTAAQKCKSSLHLNCKKCGRTFHAGDFSADLIVNNLAKSENFDVDKSNTVIYGICSKCR